MKYDTYVVVIKLASLLCFSLMVLLLLLRHQAFYELGYLETADAFSAIDPLRLLFRECALFIVLFGLLIISLFQRKQRGWMICAVLAFWPLFVLVFKILPAPGPQIAYGLCDKIMGDFTLVDLRHFAREFDRDLPGVTISRDYTKYMSIDQLAAFGKLKDKYPFIGWTGEGPGPGFGPSISKDGDVMNLMWGGALPGHWGFSVALNGEKINPPPDPDATIKRASDDIYFYYGD